MDSHGIIDSMLIPVYEFSRAVVHKIFRELGKYSKCPSKKKTYLGFKLHLLSYFDYILVILY